LHQSNIVNTSATAFNEAHLMVVSGNAGDSLTVSSSQSLNPGAWSIASPLNVGDRATLNSLGFQFVVGDSYSVYTNGLATLIVDNAVSFQVV
jgi:hypothetical protein